MIRRIINGVGVIDILETLGVTAEHPFWVEGKGWTNAGDLAIDDEISTLENGVVKVASIASDAKKHTTYNFEVEDFHTYFVGESALWVHNTCIDFDAIVALKSRNFGKLGAAEQRKALSLIDNFQQRFQRGLGVNSLNDIRNVRGLGKGLFEIKATGSGQTGAVRVFLDCRSSDLI